MQNYPFRSSLDWHHTMYSIANFLSTYPPLLSSTELADALGCSVRTANQLCRDQEIVASKECGRWSISTQDLVCQLQVLRNITMPVVKSHPALGVPDITDTSCFM